MRVYPSDPQSDSGEAQPVRHLVTPIELALVAAVMNAQQSSEYPGKAVDRAAGLIHEAERRIHSPFHQDDGLSEEESDFRDSHRLQRKKLFENPLPVAAAFNIEKAGYKDLGRFASALRAVGLSYEDLESKDGGWRVVEITSLTAVARLPQLNGARATKLNTANKKQKREILKKNAGTADNKSDPSRSKSSTPERKSGTAVPKKRTPKKPS